MSRVRVHPVRRLPQHLRHQSRSEQAEAPLRPRPRPTPPTRSTPTRSRRRARGSTSVDNIFDRRRPGRRRSRVIDAGGIGPVQSSQVDADWKGAWDDNPHFHAPSSCLTTIPAPVDRGRRPARPSTSSTPSPADALQTARRGRRRQERAHRRVSPTVVRDFLAARLIDHAHVVVVPILLGRGVQLLAWPRRASRTTRRSRTIRPRASSRTSRSLAPELRDDRRRLMTEPTGKLIAVSDQALSDLWWFTSYLVRQTLHKVVRALAEGGAPTSSVRGLPPPEAAPAERPGRPPRAHEEAADRPAQGAWSRLHRSLRWLLDHRQHDALREDEDLPAGARAGVGCKAFVSSQPTSGTALLG